VGLQVVGIIHCAQWRDLSDAYTEFERLRRQHPTAVAVTCFAFEPRDDQPGIYLFIYLFLLNLCIRAHYLFVSIYLFFILFVFYSYFINYWFVQTLPRTTW
jgi:hypothetical protein